MGKGATLTSIGLFALLGCGGPLPCKSVPAVLAKPIAPSEATTPPRATDRTLSIRLRALEADQRRVGVTIEAYGDVESWLAPKHALVAPPTGPSGASYEGTKWRLPKGTKHAIVSYSIDLGPVGDPPFVRLDQVLALPAAFVDRVIDVHLAHEGGSATSVFFTNAGTGEVDLETSGARLGIFFLAHGAGGTAFFRAPEGEDTTGWLGFPRFDARAVGAEIAGFRSRLYERFRESPSPRETVLFSVELAERLSPVVRPEGVWDVTRRPFGIVARISGQTPYDRGLRLAVAEATLERFLGERLFIGDPKAPEATAWFQKGLLRGLAMRELALSGLLSLEEYARELTDLATTATFETQGPLVPVARGALYFHEITTLLGGADKFWALLAPLYAKAAGHAVPEATWHDLVRKELGEKGDVAFRSLVTEGKVSLRSFGCIRSQASQLTILRYGFDLPASLAEGHLVGLAPSMKSLGLSDADRLARLTPNANGKTLDLDLLRGSEKVHIVTPTLSERRPGPRMSAAPNSEEERCRALLR